MCCAAVAVTEGPKVRRYALMRPAGGQHQVYSRPPLRDRLDRTAVPNPSWRIARPLSSFLAGFRATCGGEVDLAPDQTR